MRWNEHSEVTEGSHAFLSASKYAWLNYDLEKLIKVYENHLATLRGTQMHEFASYCIRMKQRLPEEELTLNMFVNDCIKFNMQSEQCLKYSEYCYGTADGIGYDEELKILRIFDLKTGSYKASMLQLLVYAALFCLEYEYDPYEIHAVELCIYQHNKVSMFTPTSEEVRQAMNKIILADKTLREYDAKGGDYNNE